MTSGVYYTIISKPSYIQFTCPHCKEECEAPFDEVDYVDDYWGDGGSDGKSFGELIDFSDCEGVIGSVISLKLYDDFIQNRTKASNSCGDDEERQWAMKLYDHWTKAFEIAKDDGMVIFY